MGIKSTFISILKATYYSLLSIILIHSTANAQFNNCSTCYSAKDQECSTFCTKNFPNIESGKYQKCKRTCVVNGCNDVCRYGLRSGTDSSTPEVVNCDYCTRNSTSHCTSKCNSEEKGETCIKNCISQTCKGSCTLPESTNDLYSSGDTPSCESCKKTHEDPCKGKCGRGSGSYACAVACVERACESNCLID